MPAKELVGQRPEVAEPTARFGKDSISLQITIVARMMRNMFDRQVAALGITRSQWSMIVAVSQLPGATQRTIAETLEMSEASAGRLIDRLCADGLLERRPRSDDRRAHAVHLSAEAQPLLDQLAAAGKVLEAKLFRGFEQDDMTQLQNLLNHMYANLERG